MSRRIRLAQDSRMQATPLFQLRDEATEVTNTYAWGTWEAPDIPDDPSDEVHIMQEHDLGRLDLLAQRFYGSPRMFWVILHVNNIMDQFTTDPTFGLSEGAVVRIPRKERVFAILLGESQASTRSTLA